MIALGLLIDIGGLGALGLLVARCYKSSQAEAASNREVTR